MIFMESVFYIWFLRIRLELKDYDQKQQVLLEKFVTRSLFIVTFLMRCLRIFLKSIYNCHNIHVCRLLLLFPFYSCNFKRHIPEIHLIFHFNVYCFLCYCIKNSMNQLSSSYCRLFLKSCLTKLRLLPFISEKRDKLKKSYFC